MNPTVRESCESNFGWSRNHKKCIPARLHVCSAYWPCSLGPLVVPLDPLSTHTAVQSCLCTHALASTAWRPRSACLHAPARAQCPARVCLMPRTCLGAPPLGSDHLCRPPLWPPLVSTPSTKRRRWVRKRESLRESARECEEWNDNYLFISNLNISQPSIPWSHLASQFLIPSPHAIQIEFGSCVWLTHIL